MRRRTSQSRAVVPFLLNVQSDLLEEMHSRVVIPLSKAATLTRKPVAHLVPLVEFEGQTYVLMTPHLAAISRDDLGPPAGSLAERRDTIIAAMDFLSSGF